MPPINLKKQEFSIKSRCNFVEITRATCLLPPKTFKFNDSKSLLNYINNLIVGLSITETAIDEFINNNYRSFDAIIGNNSCYLISYYVYDLATKMHKNHTYKEYLSNIKTKIFQAKKTLKKTIELVKNKNFKGDPILFINKTIHLMLDADILFLGMAFACSIAKKRNQQHVEEIDYDIFLDYCKNNNFEITKNSSIKLIKYWQKTLSILSVRKLQSDANQIKSKMGQQWAKYLSDRYILKDKRGRLCASSLYSAASIYNLLLEKPGSILSLQVNITNIEKNATNTFNLYYKITENRRITTFTPSDQDDFKPVYLFRGCRYIQNNKNSDLQEIESEFKEKNLETIILAHEVTYPQYPKSLKANNIIPSETELLSEYIKYKKMTGFSIDNPADLCLAHISIDTITPQFLSSYDSALVLPTAIV